MDVLRRNTDYALRAMVHLARNWRQGPVSARHVAEAQCISYQLTCKLLQRLGKAGLVKSQMGAKGGFSLSRAPGRIHLWEVVETTQGPVRLNRCLGRDNPGCDQKKICSLSNSLAGLQKHLERSLRGITLAQLAAEEKR